MPTLLKEVNLTTPATQQDIDLSDVDVSQYKALKAVLCVGTNFSGAVHEAYGKPLIRINGESNNSYYYFNTNDNGFYIGEIPFLNFNADHIGYTRGEVVFYPMLSKHANPAITGLLGCSWSTISENLNGGYGSEQMGFSSKNMNIAVQSNVKYENLSTLNISVYNGYETLQTTSLTAKVYGYTENNLFMI